MDDDFGYASGAMVFHMVFPANGRSGILLVAPLTGAPHGPDGARGSRIFGRIGDTIGRHAVARPAQQGYHPTSPIRPAINDTLRTSLAYILISRDGPALQPGTRSYARSWIREVR